MTDRLRQAPAPATADTHPGVGLRPAVVGKAVIGVGVFMAVMPFFGPAVGLPLDGAAWEWTVDRMVLHLVPGVLGVLLGSAVLRVGSAVPAERAAMGRPLALLGVVTVALGGWMGAGPWLYDLIVPGAGQSGLMFLGVPGWAHMSPLHQAALETVCHWGPGVLMVAAGVAVYSVGEGLSRRAA